MIRTKYSSRIIFPDFTQNNKQKLNFIILYFYWTSQIRSFNVICIYTRNLNVKQNLCSIIYPKLLKCQSFEKSITYKNSNYSKHLLDFFFFFQYLDHIFNRWICIYQNSRDFKLFKIWWAKIHVLLMHVSVNHRGLKNW